MLVYEYLERSKNRYPGKTALVMGENRYTYSRLWDLTKTTASKLRSFGVGRHDRVVIHSKNDVSVIATIFAASMVGSAFVVLNPEMKGKRLEYITKDCEPKAIVCDSIREGMHPKEMILSLADIEAEQIDHVLTDPSIDIDMASIIYTSGSTGSPKGIMLSHLNMDTASDSIISYLNNDEHDIILSVLPLSFDYGLYQLLMGIKFGGTVILEQSFIYPDRALTRIKEEGVTGFPIVPTIGNILNRLKVEETYDLSSVRYLTNTAQALTEKIINGLKTKFPNAEIYSMYGLTECKRVSYLDPSKLGSKPMSVGKAMPNTETYLIDEEGNRIDEPGVKGELVVRGSNVMMGNWRSPEETEKRLIQGEYPGEKALLTGDIFFFDDERDLYFVTRKDEIIKTAGERVNPLEIENYISTLDGVSEVIVIPVTDEILGNALKAVMSMDDHLKIEDIKKFCRRGLEGYMVPRFFEIIDHLPKNQNGKLDRKRIKKDLDQPVIIDERKQMDKKITNG